MTKDGGAVARLVTLGLGVWLIASAFAWPDSGAQRVNAWVTGGLAIVFSLVAYAFAPRARFLSMALALWLFASPVVLRATSSTTIWNDVIVSLAMFAASFMARGRASLPPTGRVVS